MTIDERLDRLTERHLTQTLELLTIDIRSLEGVVRMMADGIRDLVTVARSHEMRISDLESPA